MKGSMTQWKEVRDVRKDYTTPELLVHGSIEDLTLSAVGKAFEGNDGCGMGEGEGSRDPDGTGKDCS
jgi:hypothetical protein